MSIDLFALYYQIKDNIVMKKALVFFMRQMPDLLQTKTF
jgi:hypothetical protein